MNIQELDEELLELYKTVLQGDSINDVKPILRDKWNDIKNNEEVLSSALKLAMNPNYTLIGFSAPTIVGLILQDYENVDPLAYDVVTRLILNNVALFDMTNPLLTQYNLPYGISILFNKDFHFSEKMHILNSLIEATRTNKYNALYSAYFAYMHPEFDKSELFRFVPISKVEFDKLLSNYEERAKLRKLTKLPF